MIRKLTKEDTILIKQILPPSKIEHFTNTYLTGLKTWNAFGFFKDNICKGISTSYYSAETPEWYLLNQYSDRSDDMEEMVKEVCCYYEQQHIYRICWLDADYYIDFMKNFIPEQYLHFRDYSVDPFLFPKWNKHYYILYNQQTFPVATRVYVSVLPEEYRTN
jgi:hypothetical protein